MSLAEAYATCEAITREQARNFYYGIRLLPPAKREVLCAVYALARQIDDIGDGAADPVDKRLELAGLRAQWHEQAPAGAVVSAVLDATRRYPVPLGAFDELVEGMRMDIDGRRYASFDELADYCRCVAGSVGRLCLGVFGHRPHPDAAGYADTLGIALQQTNILRDLREDLLIGRVYLPEQELHAFGVELTIGPDGRLADPGGRLSALVRDSAARARRWYADGLRLLPLLDRRSAACCAAMAGIYVRLLGRIAADPTLVLGGRLSLSTGEKARVAARAMVRGRA